MKTYDLTDDEGRVFGFEVSNAFFPRSTACRVVQRIPGAKLIRGPRIFPSEDEFCEFELEGVTFVLWEPWGDNSRYWIGPKTGQCVPQLDRVREEFVRWQPFGFFRHWVACLRRTFHASHAA
jgi:hypothetical protein